MLETENASSREHTMWMAKRIDEPLPVKVEAGIVTFQVREGPS